LDFLVDALIDTPEVYGARLTGGGFGGAVMALTAPALNDTVAEKVASQYEKRFGARPDILHTRTGDGAELVPL
jgi:galactokinase